MPTNRLEAFSDGVLAIIITIMVLELPRPEGNDLPALEHLWPALATYLLSFLVVGGYWNNHHQMFTAVKSINGAVMWANLGFLLCLSLLPYATGWVGESHFAPFPMGVYAFVNLAAASSYGLLTVVARRSDPANRALVDATSAGVKEKVSVLAFLLAVFAPFLGHVGVVISGLLVTAGAGIWVIPDPRIARRLAQAGAPTRPDQ